MSWEIFLGIVALVGFIASVSGPMINLNTSITRLNDSVENLHKSIEKLDEDNEKDHVRIWKHNDEQDKEMEDHEKRIKAIESKMEITYALHPDFFSNASK